jgi:hypothetical protein
MEREEQYLYTDMGVLESEFSESIWMLFAFDYGRLA